MNVDIITKKFPTIKATLRRNEYGEIIVLTGKNAKVVANYFARENYLQGGINTMWKDVRFGLGFAIPLYDDPMDLLFRFGFEDSPYADPMVNVI